jgi:PAS domain S-box-containing protein
MRLGAGPHAASRHRGASRNATAMAVPMTFAPRGREEYGPHPPRGSGADASEVTRGGRENAVRSRADEEKFRLAVEACPNGMIMTDAAGTIVMVNSEIERQFGYRRDELIGHSVDMLVPEHGCQRDGLTHVPERRRTAGARDLVGMRKDGGELAVEIRLNPIDTRDGPMVVSAIVDISERKRLERLKDEFVSMASHELRTPLTSIAGSLGLLIGNAAGQLPAAAVRLLTIAYANSQRLVRLINDILDLQKIESGQVVFHLKYLDLRALLERTIEANGAFAQEFGVRIRLDAGGGAGEVFADSDRLEQIITNLVSNAIKFSPAGGEVTVGVERRGDNMRAWVRDRGPGIPEAFKARIFEKFAQADSSDTRQKGGTGLGLSIVKQLIQQHGGKVGFEAAPGGGTVFYFELPSAAPAQADCTRQPDAAGRTIMLCDEDAATSGLLADALRRAGFAVEAASTAAGAQAHAADTPYAAVLIDPRLPDRDGISLVRELHALPRHAATPVIFFAINPTAGARAQGGVLSVCDWLAKPADPGQLVRVIHQAIADAGVTRPRVLHLEPDPELRRRVHETLRAHADIVSTDSIDGARHALDGRTFDLAVLDLGPSGEAELDVLTLLHDHNGHAITALLFSADTTPALARRMRSLLATESISLDAIVATVRLAVARRGRTAQPRSEVA